MDWMNQTQEMFKTWTDVQKKTWDTWLDGVKQFDASQPTQVWEKTLDAWQASIKNTLNAQVEGSRIWAESVTSVKGAPQGTADWANQVQEMTKRWTDMQEQMWNNWFEVMKKMEPAKFPGSFDKDNLNFLGPWQDMSKKIMDAQAEWARNLVSLGRSDK